ncbi:MAG: PrgI family protein [Hominilimicola sp.]
MKYTIVMSTKFKKDYILMYLAGFFNYNGMNFEEFIGAWFRSEFLAAGVRKFESTNYLYEIVKEELDNGNIQSVRKKNPNKKSKSERLQRRYSSPFRLMLSTRTEYLERDDCFQSRGGFRI